MSYPIISSFSASAVRDSGSLLSGSRALRFHMTGSVAEEGGKCIRVYLTRLMVLKIRIFGRSKQWVKATPILLRYESILNLHFVME